MSLRTQYTLSHVKIRNFLIYNIFLIMMMIIIIIIAELHAREARLSIQEKFGYYVSVRSPVRTDAGGGGKGVRGQSVGGGVCYS